MKWGLFGGTFDPIHFGHLRCAQDVLETLALHRICFVPSSRPPFKHDPNLTPFGDRLEMVRLAIAGNPAFEVTDVEDRREGISYSIDTVRALKRERKTDPYFIIGRDAFEDIQMWKDWEEFLALCHLVIMTRPGYTSTRLEPALPSGVAAQFRYRANEDAYIGAGGKMILFRRVTFLDISSTDIRERIRKGRSVQYLVPDAVRTYILRKKLYS